MGEPIWDRTDRMSPDSLSVAALGYAAASVCAAVLIKSLVYPSFPGNLPPFPVRPYPILGHLPYLTKGQRQKLVEWRKTTGDIYSLYVGSQLVVILNGYKTVRDGLVGNADALSDQITWNPLEASSLGIFLSDYSVWKEQRTIALTILRSPSMGPVFLSTKISEEITHYLDHLGSLWGRHTTVTSLTRASIANVICSIAMGRRLDHKDPFFTSFLESFDKQMQAMENICPVLVCPWLRHIPGNFLNAKTLTFCVQELLDEFCDSFIDIARRYGDQNMPNCFIAEYWKAMLASQGENDGTALNQESLRMILLQLFLAGTDTTAAAIVWFIQFMLNYPEIQEKIYREIVATVGRDRTPDLQDKAKLSFTVACIMETQRLACIAHTSAPHFSTSADITVQGYTIPAGTTVIPNLDSVMLDADTWEEPLHFWPERFLSSEGSLVQPEAFMPLSAEGSCMCEPLANTTLFLFISSLVQRFQLHPREPGKAPTARPVDATVTWPGDFQVCFIDRAFLSP